VNQTEKVSMTVAVISVFPGQGGGAVFFGGGLTGKTHHFVADYGAISGVPEEGEIWTVDGKWEKHPQHGLQVRIEKAQRTRPSGEFIVRYLAYNKAFKGIGIGVKKAERLWKAFGEELYTILTDGNLDKLSRVVTPMTAEKLVESWRRDVEDGEVLYLLVNYGLNIRLANKVKRVWGKESLQKIQENPYRMLAFAGWDKVDRMARSFGILEDDPRRQSAAVEACLYRRLEAKHTVTPHEIAVKEVSLILRAHDRAEAQAAIELAASRNAIAHHSVGYQPVGAAFMESVIADRFQAMIGGSTNSQLSLFSVGLKEIIANTIEGFARNHGITLNNEQKAGVKMAVSLPLSVLTGGAGVGKTTVLKVIHEICEQTGAVVRQMALSGRAAQRMREATGRDATTIAKFLREADDGKIDSQSEPLLIIDECSMLDLSLMYSVVRALPERARLLLVGDPYQLPPIGFGLVFQILTSSPNVPRVELTQVHRQAESTGIPQIAFEIRHGIMPQLLVYDRETPGMYFIESGGTEIVQLIKSVVGRRSKNNDTQILGITKRGNSGVLNINANFHAEHLASYKLAAKIRSVTREFAEGEPVIHLTNDYEKELWNGSLGVVEQAGIKASDDGDEARFLRCTFEGVEHEILECDFNNIDLAYAITVHKAQGSQFKKIVIPVTRSRLLDRTLIYTALTRGVEQVVFIGDRRAFNEAVVSPPSPSLRKVGFTM
jgi:exodeoxyribonuclease V alpha subunit